jgi:hypothetical protein
MQMSRRIAAVSRCARGAALITLTCAVTAGCASPLGSGWADFRSRRAIERVASDDSFPSAAEAGLNMPEAASSKGG